jgi:tyrosyl-tRNA synthetase
MKNDLFTPQFEAVSGQATPASAEMQGRVFRGIVDAIPREEFVRKLEVGEKMRVYIGADPTRPDLHIGHAVILRALRALQDLGHEVVFLIGDFTGRIGDPTGKDAARTALSTEQVMENAETYREQVQKIIDFTESAKTPAIMAFNADWLGKLSFEDVIQLASQFTVQQMLERDMFENRMKNGQPIYVHEFFYPIMQGYDSVAMDVDVEVGGTDQLFNMLAGRSLLKTATGKEKIVLTFELLLGLDGRKMSKSYDNYVGISDAPNEMYGKLMSLADELIPSYWKLCTDVSDAEIEAVKAKLESGELHPRDAKMQLARVIVEMYHDAAAAELAQEAFVSQFQKKERPDDIPEVRVAGELNVVELVVASGLAASNGEARRLIEQGGVKLNDEKLTDITASVSVKNGDVLQVGKRRFAKLIVE